MAGSLTNLRRALAWVATCALVCAAADQVAAQSPQIAFASEFGGGELYVMDANTLAITKTQLGLATIEDLTYSRPLKTLAFGGTRKGTSARGLFLLKWPGDKLERIPKAKGESPYRPQFDPQGRYLYAVDYGVTIARYSLVERKWARIPVVAASRPHIQEVAFSPSGKLAAISKDSFKGFLIAEVAADHFRVTRELLSDFDSCISPHWLDESHIVVLCRKIPGLQFVWTLDLTTEEVHQLTQAPLGTRDFLSVSGDSRSVVFTGIDKQYAWTLWRLRLENSKPVQLLPPKQDDSYLFPTWMD